MTEQLQIVPLPDRALLSCGHYAPVDHEKHPRTREGWYAAVRCQECGRAVGVTLVAFGTPKTGTLGAAGGEPPREGGSSARAAGPLPLETR